MSEKNKIEELEKKLDETRKIVDELVYHFIYNIGEVYRSSKKEMLKKLKDKSNYVDISNAEMIFGKDYSNKLGLDKFAFGSIEGDEKLDGIIDEMTEEECEIKLNKIFKAQENGIIESYNNYNYDRYDSDDMRELDNKISDIEDGDSNSSKFEEFIRSSSEILLPIFEKIEEKKDLEVEQFREELITPYIEKYNKILQKIEEQKNSEKLAKIREKEEELERLKKGL